MIFFSLFSSLGLVSNHFASVYSSMATSTPMPVTNGSLVFLFIAVGILAVAWGLAHMKRLSKDSAQ